jgi:hypothetical protein
MMSMYIHLTACSVNNKISVELFHVGFWEPSWLSINCKELPHTGADFLALENNKPYGILCRQHCPPTPSRSVSDIIVAGLDCIWILNLAKKNFQRIVSLDHQIWRATIDMFIRWPPFEPYFHPPSPFSTF